MNNCQKCGVCCRLFPVNLSEAEFRSGRYRTRFSESDFSGDWREITTVGANLLVQKESGGCVYLENNRCSIHSKRPVVCRDFYCSSEKKGFRKMIRQIRQAKKTLALSTEKDYSIKRSRQGK